MATSFSNSMRSLQVNSPRKTLAGLILSIVLAIVWFSWFLLAQISLYQISDTVQITEKEVVIASFPPEASEFLEVGKNVSLQLDGQVDLRLVDGEGTKTDSIPAVVLKVHQLQNDRIDASILIYWDAVERIQFIPNLTGQVQIDIERVSPVTLVIRSARSVIEASNGLR